ncbi:MAG: hypothetical protein WCJ58_04365 [bacterium]
MSNFSFVKDKILRTNIDIAFEHILNLTTIQNDDRYNSPNVLSSFRKTILIYTVSIIEALLLFILKNKLIIEINISGIANNIDYHMQLLQHISYSPNRLTDYIKEGFSEHQVLAELFAKKQNF